MLNLELVGDGTVMPVRSMLAIAGYDIYEVYVSFHPYYRIKPEKKIIELDKTLSGERKQFLLAHILQSYYFIEKEKNKIMPYTLFSKH